MNLETQKTKIIEEIYKTGRYQGMYMGVYSNNKQNPIKAYIRQWLNEKGIKENMNTMINDFYQELFIHIGKIKAEKLIELAQNNKQLFATICTIIKRQLMKTDENPIINFLKKYLIENHNLKAELDSLINQVEYTTEEFKVIKKITKKQLKAEINQITDLDYLLKVLKVHQDVASNRIKSTNVSYFEKLNHNSIQLNKDGLQLQAVEDNKEDEELLFTQQYGMSVNDIMDAMTRKELMQFKRLANRKIRRGEQLTKEQKEREKKYWDALETRVLQTVNRIKFNR